MPLSDTGGVTSKENCAHDCERRDLFAANLWAGEICFFNMGALEIQ